MRDIAIRVEGLGKKFSLTGKRESYKTLRDTLAHAALAPYRALRSLAGSAKNGTGAKSEGIVWALKDVSFEIGRGEVVGIIGRNGAGKSTLLKILSRVTEPTKGYADVYGRVGSLLEVGTGFHPELSGRENIYLNGAILGMRRAEIERNFDAIVAFAEVEKFIDTPVKHYSSGMYLRLAFAVAAHLQPEILLVDEVLAVGDAAFQKKCMGKMGEVASEGRTVLVVSHNMAVVQALCNRAIFLHNGTVLTDDTASEAVGAYLRTLEQGASEDLLERAERRGRGQVRLSRVEMYAGGDNPTTTLATGRPAQFIFYVTAIQPGLSCAFTIYDNFGNPVTTFNSARFSQEDTRDPAIGGKLVCRLDELSLVPGRYRINVAISSDGQLQDHLEGAAFFDVEQGTLRGRPVIKGNGYGSVSLSHRWTVPTP